MTTIVGRQRTPFGLTDGRDDPTNTKVRSRASATDMAEFLRAGIPIEDLAEIYDIAESTIKMRLIDGGWSSSTGQPNQPEPTPERTQPAHPYVNPPWNGTELCTQTDPELFYPEKGQNAKEAKRICRHCPIRKACLEYAMTFPGDQQFGIWGGTTGLERRKLARTIRCQHPGCKSGFATQRHLDRHVVMVHRPPVNPQTCGVCGRGFNHLGALTNHSKAAHPDQLAS